MWAYFVVAKIHFAHTMWGGPTSHAIKTATIQNQPNIAPITTGVRLLWWSQCGPRTKTHFLAVELETVFQAAHREAGWGSHL